MHGHGVYKWKDGRKYVGDYVQDKKHGFGKYYWEDGRVFEGEWRNGKRNGEGKLLYPNGEIKHGVWHGDKRDDNAINEANDEGRQSGTQKMSKLKSDFTSSRSPGQRQKENRQYAAIHSGKK